MQELSLEHHPIFLFACVVAGLGYAYLLYSKKSPWSNKVNRLLFVLRAILVCLIAALLVVPIIRQVINETEKPHIVVAVDNSASLKEVRDSIRLAEYLSRIDENVKSLESKGFDVETRVIEKRQPLSEMVFDASYTDLSELLLDIKADYEGRNLAEVVLVSDGIYNSGISPTYAGYSFPISTIGIGDSLAKSDLRINALLNNKLAYQGNRFPVVVQVTHEGYRGAEVQVSISKNGQLIERKSIKLGSEGQVKDVQFILDAKESGFQRYQVSVTRLENEVTYNNNSKSMYIEVIDGKEKIAIIADSPHPDIMAIRSAIQSNANYELEQFILSNSRDVKLLNDSPKDFDLVIFHQLPSRYNRAAVSQMISKSKATLFILGNATDLAQFNEANPLVTITQSGRNSDKITGSFNTDFQSFKLSENLQSAFEDFPPLTVPFGSYELKGEGSILLYQQVGSIVTGKPLLLMQQIDGKKSGVMLSAGLWKWKLADYAGHGNNDRFDELIGKLIQYLSTKDDRRKFRFTPVKNEISINEPLIFDIEAYNDLYEEIYGVDVQLVLTDSNGEKFDYTSTTSTGQTQMQVAGLERGVYDYEAVADIGGKREKVSGQVVIQELKLESLNLTADFALLNKLSSSTGGSFFSENEWENFEEYVTNMEAVGIIHSKEKLRPFINIEWLLVLLVILISIEWFIRKYQGSY